MRGLDYFLVKKEDLKKCLSLVVGFGNLVDGEKVRGDRALFYGK